jgi:hypothetical protein
MWRLRPGTVTRVDTETRSQMVLFDGESVAVPVTSLVGTLMPRGRVMCAYVPPSGTYVVGWIGDPTPGEGAMAAYSEANSAAIGTAATTVLSVDVTLRAFSAYRVTISGGILGSVAGNLAFFQLKRSDTTTQITEFYRWRTEGAPVISANAVRYVRNDSPDDARFTMNLTLTASAGTVTHAAGVGRARFIEVQRAGSASAYPHAQTLG